MIRFAGLYFILLLYTFCFALCNKKKFGESIPISFVLLVAQVFICSCLGNVYYLKYPLILSVIVCITILVYRRTEITLKLIKKFFSFGFIIYTILFVYFYFRLHNIKLSNIDDLYYYSTLVKDCLRNKTLYADKTMIVADHHGNPPFCTLLQSAFCIILGETNESYMILSMVSFSLSFFMTMFDKLETKFNNLLKTLVVFVLVIVLSISVQMNNNMPQEIFIYNSIYNDWLISIVTAFLFYIVITKNDCLIILTIVGSALCLIKPHCLPLYLMVATVYIFKELVINKKNIKNIIMDIFIIFIPLVIYLGVAVYKSSFDGKNAITQSLAVVDGSISKDTESIELKLIPKFISALVFEPIMLRPISLSYSIIVIIEAVLLFATSIKYRKTTTVFYLLGAVGYAFMMYLLFRTRGETEGLGLVMYGRYMQTYTYFGLLLIAYLVVEYFELKVLTIFTLSSLLFIEPHTIKYLNPLEDNLIFKEKERRELQYYFDTQYKNEKILVIDCTNVNVAALIMNIAYTNKPNLQFDVGVPATKNIDEFIKDCKKNDYLLIGDYDDAFYNDVWKKTTDTPCYNMSLYKIIKNGNNVEFELMFMWDE